MDEQSPNTERPATPTPEIPAVNSGSPEASKKLTKKTIIPLIALVVLLLLGAGLALTKSPDESQKDNKTPSTSVPTNKVENNNEQAFAATQVADYDQVCKGGVATNATDYESGPSPHPVVLFSQGNINPDAFHRQNISYSNRTWDPDSDKIETVQLVGCLKSISQGSSKKCEFQAAGEERLFLDYYAVTYELTVREAKTGKAVGTKQVNGPNLTCPSYTSYGDDHKIYAQPDQGLMEEAVKEFVLR